MTDDKVESECCHWVTSVVLNGVVSKMSSGQSFILKTAFVLSKIDIDCNLHVN